MTRHPLQVTADRMDKHLDDFEDELSGRDYANVRDAARALRRVAEDHIYDAGGSGRVKREYDK